MRWVKRSTARARFFRRNATPTERVMWTELRQLQFSLDLKFRRQHPAGPYFLDFACPSKMLAVELDGAGHLTRVVEDQLRDEWLADQGWLVLRFGNHQIVHELESVLETIVSAAGRR